MMTRRRQGRMNIRFEMFFGEEPSHSPSLSLHLSPLILSSIAMLAPLIAGYLIGLQLDQFFSSDLTSLCSSIDFSMEIYCWTWLAQSSSSPDRSVSDPPATNFISAKKLSIFPMTPPMSSDDLWSTTVFL